MLDFPNPRETGIRINQETTKNQMRTDATSGTHPLTRRHSANASGTISCFGDFRQLDLPELVTAFCEPRATDVRFSSLQIRKIPN